MNGILNVYKERDFTSHDVVAKLRGICRQKKIGHTGTLDPQAEGVLPVCLGNATKLCNLLTDKSKEYEAVLLLGKTTDTQDAFGKVLAEEEVSVNESDVTDAILSFVGEYDQIPPMYSALKVNGKKLYELARQGIEIERQARRVLIMEIKILEMNLPRVKMRVSCSKGTYIRTLCHDIGQKLHTGGIMESLLRTRVGMFTLENSLRLREIEALMLQGSMEQALIQTDEVFDTYERIITKPETDCLLYNGNIFLESGASCLPEEREFVRVYDSKGVFAGIYEYEKSRGCFKPYKMFLEN
ncbi:MAG: tRNA pseudouridine(55) synthase TruB [Lachnospiraceae bacterium]